MSPVLQRSELFEARQRKAPSAAQSSIARRLVLAEQLVLHPEARRIEMALCAKNELHWFDNWAWTYDPRERIAHKPFDLFPRQREMVRWFKARLDEHEDGHLEKSRDVGFTWVAGGFALHRWIFKSGFKTTIGSRKGEYVDRIGDPDSIFEKIRMMMRALPTWMLPPGFMYSKHDNSMLLLNPFNENTIRGEAGEEMGRGGRSTWYIVDEAAFIERAERVDASTSANTDCRIWASSVNGMDNMFARKRFGGSMRPEQMFRFHYTDDPRKTPEWAATKKASLEPHVWASEYDIDYAASVEGICIPAAWVESAKRIAKLMKIEPLVDGIAGGDIGAGKAKSVWVARFGPVVTVPTAWSDPDTIDTAHKMLDHSQAALLKRDDGHECKVKYLRYDSVGVGFGIAAVMRRNQRPGLMVTGVNTGEPPTDTRWPDGEISKEKFANLKAEAWWTMRSRFKMTHEMVLHLEGKDGGIKHQASDLISIPGDDQGPQASQLATQISCVKVTTNEKGKIIMEPKKAMMARGVASPDAADALVLTFAGSSKAETWAKMAKVAV